MYVSSLAGCCFLVGWVGGYSTHVSTAAAVTRVVAVDVASDVGEGEVSQFYAGVIRSVNRAGAALVDVGLGDEDWEGDVVDADVAPSGLSVV
jgi:hypothetical protein